MEFILQVHMWRNLLLSMFVNGGLWKTIVYVVTTITNVYGHQNLSFVKGSQHWLAWSIALNSTSFAKDPLGSSNPNRAIMQYMCHWHLAHTKKNMVPYSRKVWWDKVWRIYSFQAFCEKKVWRMNRFSQKVIFVSRNLDGFSLANHGWFAKFTKLSPCQTFPLYGINHLNEIFS